MTAGKIKEILDELIGPTEPIAESNYDEKVLCNMEKLTNITDYLLDMVDAIAYEYRNSQYGSCARVGQLAYDYEKKLKKELEDLE